jgi:hypothetical protein
MWQRAPIARRRCLRCGFRVLPFCHPRGNMPPSPGGGAYVVDIESPIFVTHVATCPHRPAAMLALWISSPLFLSPTWQRAPIARWQCLHCGLRVLHFCHPHGNDVPPSPCGSAYVVDFESSNFVTHDMSPIAREAILFLWRPPLPGGNAYVVDIESPTFLSHTWYVVDCGVPHCPTALLTY